MWWVAGVLAWRGRAPVLREWRYRLDPALCATLLPRFHDDLLLSWGSLTCADVSAGVRRAFDAWQYNSELVFREVPAGAPAEVVVGTRDFADATVLATATMGHANATIHMDEGRCWYMDHAFCYAVRRHTAWVLVGAGLVVGCGAGTVIVLLCDRRAWRRIPPVLRLAAWAATLAGVLVVAGAIAPCLACHDFVVVAMHEVGHAIGLGHSDEGGQRRGCGAGAVPVDAVEAGIMRSTVQEWPRACLARDDVDGVRTLHGGDCAAPVWCYETASLAGFSRVAVALVYAFALAWLVVGVRDCLCRPRWRRRARLVTVVRPVRPTPAPARAAPPATRNRAAVHRAIAARGRR